MSADTVRIWNLPLVVERIFGWLLDWPVPSKRSLGLIYRFVEDSRTQACRDQSGAVQNISRHNLGDRARTADFVNRGHYQIIFYVTLAIARKRFFSSADEKENKNSYALSFASPISASARVFVKWA